MPFLEIPRPLVVILGPTAVGKTEVAMQLAERLGGEIVSADSRLFYRGMDIGTAKPSPEERQRVPHHLIDVAEPDEIWSLPMFQQAARSAIAGIHARGRLPFLVGGTGQYVRAVVETWAPPAQEPDLRLRDTLTRWAGLIGPRELHRRLGVIDPAAAQRMDPNNLRRTVRALEVIFLTGQLFSAQQQKGSSDYALLLVGLRRPRSELYARVDARIQAMLDAGLLHEVGALLAQGYSPSLPTLSAIGYREMVAHLQGEITLDEAVTRMKRLTRHFVRKQANWFRETDETIHWFDMGPDTVENIEAFLRSGEGWLLPVEDKQTNE